MQTNSLQYLRVAKRCPLWTGTLHQVEEDLALEDFDEGLDRLFESGPDRMRQTIPKSVEHKFPKVAMTRWFQLIKTVRRS